MDKYFLGVMGDPIEHSLSPQIFQILSQILGEKWDYSALKIPPQDLAANLNLLSQLPFWRGLNITIPHKEKVLSYIHAIDSAAQEVGAVNTLVLQQGRWHGWNTDILGLLWTWEEARLELNGKKSVVFGAGGAARAVVYALAKQNCEEIYIFNRDQQRAQNICEHFAAIFPSLRFQSCKFGCELENISFPQIDFFINATSCGLNEREKEEGLFFQAILQKYHAANSCAFDVVYRPLKTSFLLYAEKLGLNTISGIDMLIYQAMASCEIWQQQNLPNKGKIKREIQEKLIQYL